MHIMRMVAPIANGTVAPDCELKFTKPICVVSVPVSYCFIMCEFDTDKTSLA